MTTAMDRMHNAVEQMRPHHAESRDMGEKMQHLMQQVEIEITVRMRDIHGKIVGESAKTKYTTDFIKTFGTGYGATIMVLRQRKMLASGIRDMAMDFVRGHFKDKHNINIG